MLMTTLRALGHRFSAKHFLSLWHESGMAGLSPFVARRRPRAADLRQRHQAGQGFGCVQLVKLGPHGLPTGVCMAHGLRRCGKAFPGRLLSGRKLELFLERSNALGVARLRRPPGRHSTFAAVARIRAVGSRRMGLRRKHAAMRTRVGN